MKRLLQFALLLSLTIPAMATTHFVRSGASGSANGSSWANAWTDVANINWSSVSAGDTVCVAGGSYGVLSSGEDGTSGNPITIERATASSSVCGSSTTGWSSGYDSQVSLSYNNTIYNNYNTLDGIVNDGILVTIPNLNSNSLVAGVVLGGSTGVIIQHIEFLGPCGTTTTCSFANVNAGYSAIQGSQSPYPAVSNLYVGYNDIYGVCNGFVLQQTAGIIEHNHISNTSTGNSATCHDNVIDSASLSGAMTFRYNDVTNWDTEGIMMQNTSGQVWYVYGNVFHDPKVEGNYARAIEAQDGSQTVHGYNNTFVNMPYAVYNTANGGTWTSSASENDLFWNTNGSGMTPTDCAWGGSSGSTCGGSGTQSLGTSTSIFTNYSAGTALGYDLASNTTAGVNLGSPYNIDYLGNTRSTWSRGAFEYQSGGPTYTLSTATAGTGSGTITGGSCAGTYASGTAYSCTVTASGGSTLTSVTGCGGSGTTTYSGTMPASNCTVTATFTLNSVVVAPPTKLLIMVQ